MFRFNGGQTVRKGTYWNLSSGERVDANENAVLPGTARENYVKLSVAGMLVAGPIAGLLFTCIIPFLFIFITLIFLPQTVLATDAVASDEAKACLGCHATPGMTMAFKDKTTMNLQVTENHFKNTVHGFVTCTGCHSNVSPNTHPASQYANKKDFMFHIASACKTCHADEQIMANPLHQRAISKANAPPCSDCHGSHSIRKVPSQKEKLSTSQYCLTCHSQQLTKTINQQSMSLTINEEGLRSSVHGKHSCTDCHTSYSKEIHPKKQFASIREVSIAASDACRRCHPDKSEQHKNSIHAKLMSEGNRKAPVCSDCHNAHAVGPKALADTMQGVPCKNCHQEVFAAYKGSVHGKAKSNGSGGAPICSTCHFAHDVKAALVSRSPKDLCIGCHANVVGLHKEWLPNAEAHFDSVACTACHVSDEYKRNVYLRLTEKSSGNMIADDRLRGAMGKTSDEVSSSKDKHLEPKQVWDIYRKLNGSGEKVTLAGTVSLLDSKNAHHLAPKGRAIQQCEYCHTADSEVFKNVSMTTVKQNGRENHYALDSATLGSTFAMLPLGQFYALGSTRIWLLDALGAAMVLGGAAVPVIHGTIRFLTRKRRSQHR